MYFPVFQAGRRNASGADIHALVRNILEHNTRVQSMREEVAVHQARQALVREQVNEVAAAEDSIDGLIKDLQVIAPHPVEPGAWHISSGRRACSGETFHLRPHARCTARVANFLAE